MCSLEKTTNSVQVVSPSCLAIFQSPYGNLCDFFLLGFTALLGTGFLGSFYSDDPGCHLQCNGSRGRL